MIVTLISVFSIVLMAAVSFDFVNRHLKPTDRVPYAVVGFTAIISCLATVLNFGLSIIEQAFFGVALFVAVVGSYTDFRSRLASRWMLRIACVSTLTMGFTVFDNTVMTPVVLMAIFGLVFFLMPSFGASDARLVIFTFTLFPLGIFSGAPLVVFVLSSAIILTVTWFATGREKTIPFVPPIAISNVAALLSLVLV